MTLASFPWPARSEWTLADLVSRVTAAAQFSLRGELESMASHPTRAFMVLFMLLARTLDLLALRQAIWDHVVTPLRLQPSSQSDRTPIDQAAWPTAWPFVPHLSLLYDTGAILTPAARLSSLSAGGGDPVSALLTTHRHYDFDSIAIMETNTDDYTNDWHTLATIALPVDTPWTPTTPIPESLSTTSATDAGITIRPCT